MESTYAAIAQLTASRCCICHAQLTDAESVEHGIGPVCSKRYYNPLHEPTEAQIKSALGLLACSALPQHIIEGFLKFVNTLGGEMHAHARQACNLLVYWASCHYDSPEEVFKCTAIIRTLGYTELADKLEMDRTVAIVREHSDHIEAYLPEKFRLVKDLQGIPGSTPLSITESSPTGQPVKRQVKIGRKVGWHFPLEQKAYFEAVLGYHCGNELACGDGKIWKIPYMTWRDLRPFKHPVAAAPPPVTGNALANGAIRIEPIGNGYLQIFTPYNFAFKEDLKTVVPYQNRRWNSVNTCWEVVDTYRTEVKGLIAKHYGVALP